MSSNVNMSNHLNYLPIFQNSTPQLELQQMISLGNAEGLKKAIEINLLSNENQPNSTSYLSTPLPNGELPLNYAIKSGEQECIKCLLELGANPFQTDDQNFSAISIAYFKEDYSTVAKILHDYIALDVELGKEIRGEQTPSNQVNKLVNAVNLASQSTRESKHKLFFIEALLKNQIPTTLKDSPLHYAILTQEPAFIFALVRNPLFEKYFYQKNSDGLTPLLYAAALGRIDIMYFLIQSGVSLEKSNEESGISCFALLASKLNQQHPLSISKYDAAIFFASIALRGAQFLPGNFLDVKLVQALYALDYSHLLSATNALTILTTAFTAYYHQYFLPNFIIDNGLMIFNVALTANLAYSTFQSLRSIYRNASFNYKKAAFKTILQVPKVQSVFNSVLSLDNYIRSSLSQDGYFSYFRSSPKPDLVKELNTREYKCIKKASPRYDFKNCINHSENIFKTCQDNPQSNKCITDANKFNTFLDAKDNSLFIQNRCAAVSQKITGNSSATLLDVKKSYRFLSILHPDKRNKENILKIPSNNPYLKLSEDKAFVELNKDYELSKKCLEWTDILKENPSSPVLKNKTNDLSKELNNFVGELDFIDLILAKIKFLFTEQPLKTPVKLLTDKILLKKSPKTS